MKYKLEIEAESYEDFIKKAFSALAKVNNEKNFNNLMKLNIPVNLFNFDYGEFIIKREKNGKEE